MTDDQGKHELKKDLRARHLSMISLGGAIGTGLFLASGSTVAGAGPAGALLAYVLIGIMVYFLMTSLGEMSAYMPDSGSFSTYSTKFVDRSFGFATGWNYWYNWAITLAFEVSAAAVIMKYWFPDVPGFIFSGIFLLIITVINFISVKGFGETEFWLASIKVTTVLVFLFFGTLLIFGAFTSDAVGLRNFMAPDAAFHGGVAGIISIFMIAGFSFQGTEFVGVAAGESENPSKDVPKAIRQVFWRILIFYVLTIFVIGALIPFNDPSLTMDDSVATSPFTYVFSLIGVPAAAAIMNAVILTAVLSAGNSGTYVSTRTLYTLAKQGDAPAMFAKINRRGIPYMALFGTVLVGALALLSSVFGDGFVYEWLLGLSALSGFISWVSIAVAHYRFRKGFEKQGLDYKLLPYKAKMFPFGPILALFACIFVICGQNYEAFLGDAIDWTSVISTYIGVPLFLILWFGHKIATRSKLVRYDEMQLLK